MTDQEKLHKLVQILHKYQGDETVFMRPAEETERQEQFRRDLYAVVTVLFGEDMQTASVEEIKKRIQTIWQETRPDDWKK